MRTILLTAVLAVIAVPAFAQGPAGQGRRGGDREARRAEMIKQFDKDGDGELNEGERAAAREARAARVGRAGRGAEGRRAAGAEGRRGPLGDPAAMFDQADTDKDGKLTKQEFVAMFEKMRAARTAQQGQRGQRGERGQRGQRGSSVRPPADTEAADELE